MRFHIVRMFISAFLTAVVLAGSNTASATLFDALPDAALEIGGSVSIDATVEFDAIVEMSDELAPNASSESADLRVPLPNPPPIEPFAPEPDALPGSSETEVLVRLASLTQLLGDAERGDAQAQWQAGLVYFRGLDTTRDPAKGLEWLRRSAAQGDAMAYQLLGEIYSTGNGVQPDPVKAVSWFEKALPAGMPITFYLLATHYAVGYGVDVDHDKARRYFKLAYESGMADGLCAQTGLDLAQNPDDAAARAAAFQGYLKAAEKGSLRCLMAVADAYARGTLVADDQAKATEWYERAARMGAAPGLHQAGIRRIQGRGQAVDIAGGIAMVKQAAAVGYIPSILAMGHSIINGVGMPRDTVIGLAVYQEMADLGVPRAMLLLGLVYRERHDWSRADEWLVKAADAGDALGFHYLANAHRFGLGRPSDPEKAIEYYRRAADAGIAQSISGLAAMYRLGEGVRQDYAKALELAVKAAEVGDPYGQWNMYLLYSKGLGVARDQQRAIVWLKRCAGQGYMDCLRMMGASHMTGAGVPADERVGRDYLRQAADLGDPLASWDIASRSYNGDGMPLDLDKAINYGEKATAPNEVKLDRMLTSAYIERQTSVMCRKRGAPIISAQELASDPRFQKADLMDEPRMRMLQVRISLNEMWANGLRSCGGTGQALCSAFKCFLDRQPPDLSGPGIDAYLADLRERADRGVPHAQLMLGTTFLIGVNGAFDPQQAFVLIEKASQGGVAEAQAILGGAYYTGALIPKDREKARYWYAQAADRGHVPVLPNLAYMEMTGEGGPKDTASALIRFRKAAEQGIGKGLYWMGRLHETGYLLPLDPVLARDYYERSVAKRWDGASLRLGFMLYQGVGGGKDETRARTLFDSVRGRGDREQAQLYLAEMDNRGIAGPVDKARAVERILSAASAGYAPAQLVAGRIYMIGKVVTQDNARAREYLTKAAESGDMEAAFLLGQLLATRFGTAPDAQEQAYVWLRQVRPHVIAARTAEVDALIARLAEQIGPAKVAELDAMTVTGSSSQN